MKKSLLLMANIVFMTLGAKTEETALKAPVPTIAGLFSEYANKISVPVVTRKKILEQMQPVLKNPDVNKLRSAFAQLLSSAPGAVQDVLIQIGAYANSNDRDTIIDAYLAAIGFASAVSIAVVPVEEKTRSLPVARIQRVKTQRDPIAEYRSALKALMTAMRGLFENEKYYKLIPPLAAPMPKVAPKKKLVK